MQFQTVVEEELVKGSEGNDGKIISKWNRLRDTIKAGATKYLTFKKVK